MRLDPAELPAPTDPIVNRTHNVHADDRRPKQAPPRDIDGKALAAAEAKYAQAVRARRETAEALTKAAQADNKALSELWEARRDYEQTERDWRATLARKRETKNG